MLETIEVQNKRIQILWINEDLRHSGKPVLVFLHEALGSIAQWKSFPNDISNLLEFPALVYDRFGSGGSDKMDLPRKKGYLEKEAFEILPELLNLLKISNFILIGHSDGASIALLYASLGNSKAKLVISEACHVFVEEAGLRGLLKAREAYENSSLRQKLEKYHGEKANDLFYAWNNTWSSEEYRDWSMEDKLEHIHCPVLLIQGEEDEYASLEQVSRVSSRVKGPAEEFIVPRCAHIPHLQAKKAVMEKMAYFIKKYV